MGFMEIHWSKMSCKLLPHTDVIYNLSLKLQGKYTSVLGEYIKSIKSR